MKIYLACLLLVTGSIFGFMPTSGLVALSQPLTKTKAAKAKVIAPAAALNRLIVAEKLEANWFTPEFLKAVDKNSDVGAVQTQRDLMMKLGQFRYGKYKSVQPIGENKYRVVFESPRERLRQRAEPDAVIVKVSLDASGRIANVGISEKNKPAPPASAQASASVALDKSFKTNTRANGETSPILTSLKQWLGNYQKVQKIDATNYLGIFDRGSAPVTINFKPDGSIENYQMGCPITKSASRSQAPANLQQVLADCPNVK